MSTVSPYKFKDYKIRCKLSWYDNSNKSIPVKLFTYQLTQYTPSVYAEIAIIIQSEKVTDFKVIENLEIKDRKIELWFEDELYYTPLKKSCFPGPFKFCVVSYTMTNINLTHAELNDENYTDAKMIILQCIDSVFYKMTLNEKFASFGKVNTSSVVEKLVSNNGGKIKKLVNSDYAYTWLQTAMTDYNMIRSILPYSRSSSGNLMYNFFMFNEECYFTPINEGKIQPVALYIDNQKNAPAIVKDDSFKYLIEQYGSSDNLYCAGRGFDDFKQTKPTKMNKQSYDKNNKGNKQHKGIGTKYINTALEDKTLQEIYISNIRHRIYTFSRMLSLTVSAYPDITPIDCIEIYNETDGKTKIYDGIFYVASVKYIYGESHSRPFAPMMHLVLCSETDIAGMENPEGSAI